MSRILFENSKFALGFAAVTIVGAGLLMGTNNSLSDVELEDESQPAPSEQVAANTAPQVAPEPQPVIADWASDEELIDRAEGFNPAIQDSAEIVNQPAPSGDSGSASSESSAASPAPTPNVGNRGGPAPATPKAARRSRALEVK